jgi:hypothetical protein
VLLERLAREFDLITRDREQSLRRSTLRAFGVAHELRRNRSFVEDSADARQVGGRPLQQWNPICHVQILESSARDDRKSIRPLQQSRNRPFGTSGATARSPA